MNLTVSESLLNQISMSLYKGGALTHTKLVTNAAVKTIFKTLQFFRQPLKLTSSLWIQVALTAAPHFTISSEDGVTVNARAKIQVFTMRASNKIRATKRLKNLLSVSAMFKVTMKVVIKGQNLILLSHQVLVNIVTKNNFRAALAKKLNTFLTNTVTDSITKHFAIDPRIPMPKYVDFTEGRIDYNKGFVTISGKLDVTQPAVEMVQRTFKKMMKKI